MHPSEVSLAATSFKKKRVAFSWTAEAFPMKRTDQSFKMPVNWTLLSCSSSGWEVSQLGSGEGACGREVATGRGDWRAAGRGALGHGSGRGLWFGEAGGSRRGAWAERRPGGWLGRQDRSRAGALESGMVRTTVTRSVHFLPRGFIVTNPLIVSYRSKLKNCIWSRSSQSSSWNGTLRPHSFSAGFSNAL